MSLLLFWSLDQHAKNWYCFENILIFNLHKTFEQWQMCQNWEKLIRSQNLVNSYEILCITKINNEIYYEQCWISKINFNLILLRSNGMKFSSMQCNEKESNPLNA